MEDVELSPLHSAVTLPPPLAQTVRVPETSPHAAPACAKAMVLHVLDAPSQNTPCSWSHVSCALGAQPVPAAPGVAQLPVLHPSVGRHVCVASQVPPLATYAAHVPGDPRHLSPLSPSTVQLAPAVAAVE